MGEWFVIWLNSPFSLIEKLSSKVLAILWEYPNIPKLNEFSLDVKLKSPNLSLSFKVKLLTLALNPALEPLATRLALTLAELYPIPVLMTIASTICPFSTIGLMIAPTPPPVSLTTTSGVELYSLPLLTTATLSTFPLTMTGFKAPFLPFRIFISGITWWFNIEEP